MLTAAELSRMRDVMEEALPGTAIIQRSTWSSDGGGGGSLSWQAVGTVSSRIAPAGGGDAVVGARLSPQTTHQATFPWDVDLRHEDRVIIGGGTYMIEMVKERDWELSTRVEVRRER